MTKDDTEKESTQASSDKEDNPREYKRSERRRRKVASPAPAPKTGVRTRRSRRFQEEQVSIVEEEVNDSSVEAKVCEGKGSNATNENNVVDDKTCQEKSPDTRTDESHQIEDKNNCTDENDKGQTDKTIVDDIESKIADNQEESKTNTDNREDNINDNGKEEESKIADDKNEIDENAKVAVNEAETSEINNSHDSVSAQSEPKENIPNGQSAPIVINRKRKWGSRAKLTTQKSITISTDILNEIMPDVKPTEFEEVIEEKKVHKHYSAEKIERPVLPKIIIDNSENVEANRINEMNKSKEVSHSNRKISIVADTLEDVSRPLSPSRNEQSCVLYITNLVRPFTLLQLKNLLQRTGRISEDGFWIDRIKSKCYVVYENEDQAVETRHALHGVTWPVSNPKALQVEFSTMEDFEKVKSGENEENVPTSAIPGTVEDWIREQDMKKVRGEVEQPWERKNMVREWDVGKGDKGKEEKMIKDDRIPDKRRYHSPERSPEPAKKFKRKEEEAPAKLLDDLFRKTKTTPCIYWLPLSAETIAVKEEQRRLHMIEHERRMSELRRRRH